MDVIERGYASSAITDIYARFNETKKNNSEIIFNLKKSFKIIEIARSILNKEPAVLKIDSEIITVGDIHGNLESLINIFKTNGDPENTKYLFLGDYIDRGQNSCEVIILLFAYKILYPNNIFLMRGNHEFQDMTDHYGFKEECYRRVKVTLNDKVYYGGKAFYSKVTNTFKYCLSE